MSTFLGKVWAQRIVGTELENLRAANANQLESLKAEYSKVQEQLRAALARLDFAHRTHYQTEFDALKDIWARVADARGAVLALRPRVDFGLSTDETHESRYVARFLVAQDAVNLAKTAILHLEPFVAPDIHKAAEEWASIARFELIDCTTTEPSDRFKDRWFDSSDATRMALVPAAEKLAALIRERLAEAGRA